MDELERRIAQAQGRESADLVIRNVKLANVFTGEVEGPVDIAIAGDAIAGIGSYPKGVQSVDGTGLTAIPGLIDGHIHVESSMLTPSEFARVVVPRGTAGLVCDPHEIANVTGLKGLEWLIGASRGLPLDLRITAPSCVPATAFETSGAALGEGEIRKILSWPECAGLGELMNFPGVLALDPEVVAKLRASSGRHVDGHAPGLAGAALNGYLAAGPCTDHEATTEAEGREKLARGMRLMIREGSSERNLKALAPLVNSNTWPRCLLVSDDRSALDLRDQGHMDHAVRRAVAEGIPPVRAIAMASLNAAAAFGFARRGALAPGYFADVVLISDLKTLAARKVFFRGRLVAQDGALVAEPPAAPRGPVNTVRVASLGAGAIWIRAERGEATAIGIVPGQIVTKALQVKAKVKDGAIVPDLDQDLLKLAVVERHTGSKRAAACLVQGFGLKRGAIASSVAHDSHNLIAAGTSDEDIVAALDAVAKAGGGQCFASGGKVEALLALPVAGLLSEKPLAEVCDGIAKLRAAVKAAGCELEAPFETLSFLALPVIPEVRLTDRGLVDVARQRFIGQGRATEVRNREGLQRPK